MKFTKILLLSVTGIFLVIGISACSGKNQAQNNKLSSHQKQHSTTNKSKTTAPQKKNDQTRKVSSKQLKKEEKWNVVSREWYTRGNVLKLQFKKNQLVALTLDVITNYHAGADPVDNPNSPHSPNKSITLKLYKPIRKSKIPFSKGSQLIVSNAQYVLKNSKSSKVFLGIGNIYYRKNGEFFNLKGQLANASFSRTAHFHNGKLIYEKSNN